MGANCEERDAGGIVRVIITAVNSIARYLTDKGQGTALDKWVNKNVYIKPQK